MVEIYRTKSLRTPGAHYVDVHRIAFSFYKKIKSKTKRRPYVRSKLFKNEKIFLELFWIHLYDKNPKDRFRRLQFFEAALELIKYSNLKPSSIRITDKNTTWYRFPGVTSAGEIFHVQIKEDKK